MGSRAAIERWFLRRGVPHLIHDYHASTDVGPELRAVLAVPTAYLHQLDRWSDPNRVTPG